MIIVFVLILVLQKYLNSTTTPVQLQMLPSAKTGSANVFNHMETIKVNFTIKATTNKTDWIGLYCQGNGNSNKDFVAYTYTKGLQSGMVQFEKVVNMRCKYQFRYIRGWENLGASVAFGMAGGDEAPVQIHLAATGVHNQMRVMWTSGRVTNPTVFYGLNKTALSSSAQATMKTYHASDMCHAPATTIGNGYWRHPGWMMQALMVSLVPSQNYFYKLGGIHPTTKKWVFSEVKTFRMPNFASNPQQKMSFFVFGDSGAFSPAASTYKLIESDLANEATTTPKGSHYAALIHIGDISYALGKGHIWDKFMALIEPVSSKLAYMIGIGNHEYCYTSGGEKDPSADQERAGFRPQGSNYHADSGGECAVPMVNRFQMPNNGNGIFWHSYDTGLVHHIMISSEHNFFIGSPMYTWLENDLKTVDRSKTPWVILYSHRPLYCSEDYKSDYKMSLMLRKHLEELLFSYGVDAVFTGHYHAFERTCSVYKGHCQWDALSPEKAMAPVHMMVGAGGYEVDDTTYYNTPWSKFDAMVNGYSRLHVHNRSHINVEFVQNKGHKIIDSSWIISDHKWSKTIPKLQRLSTKQWPEFEAFIDKSKLVMMRSNARSSTSSRWIISERKEKPGTYLISTNAFQDYYLFMTNTAGGLMKVKLGDPGTQGYWIMTRKKVDDKEYMMLSSMRWPNRYLYQHGENSTIQGIEGDPGSKGYWVLPYTAL